MCFYLLAISHSYVEVLENDWRRIMFVKNASSPSVERGGVQEEGVHLLSGGVRVSSAGCSGSAGLGLRSHRCQ